VVPLDLTGIPDPNADRPSEELIALAEKNRPDVAMDQIAMEIAQNSLKTIKNELLPSLSLYGEYAGQGNVGPANPLCTNCPPTGNLPTSYWGSFQNAFNYSSPEYQVGFELQITLRNRIAKADQFRSVLEFRRSQIQFEQQKKTIHFDVLNSQYVLQQDRARVDSAQKARDLAQKTFDITKEEQKLGSKSSLDTLAANHDLALAESALALAQNAYEKAKVDIDRAIGDTLEHTGISIDDARSGVVTHTQP
jgi:outer membrane protein TolC